MRLRVLLPSYVAIAEQVTKVRAESPSGAFTLLPRHIDWVTALNQGLLSYVPAGDTEVVTVAVDGGTLVKVGDDVIVSTPSAVLGDDPAELRTAIRERFSHQDEQDERSRAALERLGSAVVERLAELAEDGYA